ncbi:acyl CoA:acetate/3-ketoacid CoA transferase [Clostridium novyi]|uniref:Acetyl-CoA-transferase subunit, putative n=2 Tax=Clostridium novyi TaxID=1542 RepID=A0Q1E3_CLONN|nr:CoA-transferase [Clostridium novyi]ABK62212.1 acetyl-CoA-transferase subunit, putative [Clostridium novyi NT]KEH88172.1 3-oxoacid CoA-transferase [Clostridium novyi A str. NCTC 538]KEH91301.1 3-oxoacid CoA-transferase [Clostridium novyi A str. BKT29909]KEH93691.1 3-oxoacid CoA-transferase [Clostridium novyi A str. GD211209]KGN01728.1 3-oxoacid CoA-transferase [Clostridium novyi A str. 4570]
MKKVKVLTADEAVKIVKDGDTLTTSGFVSSCCPEALNKAIEKRFLETGSPKNLTLMYGSSQGNRDGSGADHYAHKGLLKRIIAGHLNTAPKVGAMCMNNEIEGYNLPQGALLHLFRDIAAHRIGTITHVGLDTFVDPRNGGGKINEITKEDLVEVVNIAGQERLLYKAFPINVGFIRGTYADEYGNITFEKEITPLEGTATAQAVKNSGGKVIVQVEKVVKGGTLDPRLVKIPGIYVDAVVVARPEDHEQSFGQEYEPGVSGEVRVPVDSLAPIPLSAKKIIGRRAAMELEKDTVVNLGIGAPEYVAQVAGEEGIENYMTLTVESGPIGGIPQGGTRFGSSLNPDCLIDQPYQFDFYDGGGLDLAFLGLAQCDEVGNINVSRFGPKIAGCGGFINITQNSKKVFFCGTFTAGGLKTKVEDGKLIIEQEGKSHKFLKQVEQVTFSGKYANRTGQIVRYITERAVFELKEDGVHLIEIAPGIDLQTQVLDLMDFVPKMDEVKLMDLRIFRDEKMNLKED